MRRAVPVLVAALLAPPAVASEATEALSACLTGAASKEDRRVLVRWIYASVSVHPDLRDVASIDTARRTALETEAAGVMERLIAEDCAAPVRRVLVADGTNGFASAFETLGRIAMEGVVAQPDVQRASAGVGERIDQQRVLKALLSK